MTVLQAQLYPVVVDPPLVPQRDRPLAWRGLWLSHQEAPIDATGEEVLGSVPGYGPVVPGVLLQRVDRSHVVGGHPAHIAQDWVGLAPLPGLVVGKNPNLNKQTLSIMLSSTTIWSIVHCSLSMFELNDSKTMNVDYRPQCLQEPVQNRYCNSVRSGADLVVFNSIFMRIFHHL